MGCTRVVVVWWKFVVLLLVVCVAFLRGAGHLARLYRDRELRRLIAGTLRALAVDVPAVGTCRNVSQTVGVGRDDSCHGRRCGAGGDSHASTWKPTTNNDKGGDSDTAPPVVAAEAGKFDAFLDWSSLLGVWREGGVIYDEEDADLGVVVPLGRTADDVATPGIL